MTKHYYSAKGKIVFDFYTDNNYNVQKVLPLFPIHVIFKNKKTKEPFRLIVPANIKAETGWVLISSKFENLKREQHNNLMLREAAASISFDYEVDQARSFVSHGWIDEIKKVAVLDCDSQFRNFRVVSLTEQK